MYMIHICKCLFCMQTYTEYYIYYILINRLFNIFLIMCPIKLALFFKKKKIYKYK